MKNRIKDILEKMTFEEKTQILTGMDAVHTKNFNEYGIQSKTLVDGPHGIRLDNEKNCTHFPNLCSLAASWDVQTAEKMGKALANECKKHHIDMLLAPGVNIKRTPFCGRNFEYFSEDPVVAGEMCAGYVNGLENEGVACSLKHFAANNQEKYRCVTSAEVDERTLREIYLKPFEIVLKKSKPTSVMCAYNKLNSVWCSENAFLLKEVLREEWGYEGFVVSDWGAVHDPVKALKAGLDLHMPPNAGITDALRAGIENGDITMEDIDKSVESILKFVLKDKAECISYDRQHQHLIAKDIASSGIVMLKNDNNVLPLTSKKYQKIAVIGEFASNPLVSGQGSAEVNQLSEYTDSPLQELRKLLPDAEINYREMYKRSAYSESMIWPDLYQPDFVNFIRESDIVLIFAGSMTSEDTEMFDRRSLELNPNYERIIEAAKEHGKEVVLILQTGSAVILDRVKNPASAIVEMWLGGEAAGSAIAEVLCGVVNPSGKLPETFPTKPRTDMDYPGNGRYVLYNEGLDVGYRYYDKHPDEICYPFGHGLSYTKFTYSDINTEKTAEGYLVTFKLKNSGEYDGAEVVQLYVSDVVATVSKPVKELKAFKKVYLKSGEEKTVTMELKADDLAYYNIMLHSWVAENGLYKLQIGSSSQDIRLETEINHDEKMPYSMQKVGDAMVGDTTACFG